MMCVIRKEAARRCGGGPKSAYNYEERGEMKEMETQHSLERRKRCLRWKLSVPRVGPIAGPLTDPLLGMSVIRIVLHNNLIFFGSPASTASRPTAVALTCTVPPRDSGTHHPPSGTH